MSFLISVIVPVYNVEKYIGKCIEDIISQSYKNLEIILVDDGSEDNSGKICDEYALKDNRISVIHKKNGGVSDARNHGIEKASGDYYIFPDSDDQFDHRMIEFLIKPIESGKADMCVCDFANVTEDKPPIPFEKENTEIIFCFQRRIYFETYCRQNY